MSGELAPLAEDERVVLDSVIVIDHLNGILEATTFLREVHGRAAV